MAECKWCKEEFCTNDECPMRADYCPVPNDEGVCRYEERIPQKNVTAESAISALQKAAQNIENMNPDDYVGLQINPTMIETRQCSKYNERGEKNV